MNPAPPYPDAAEADEMETSPMSDEERMHQIGEVADVVGLSLRTIRHYEEVGLVPPSGRTTGGFRLYTDADIERLRLVKHMKPLEFSLDELRQILDARDGLEAGVDPAEEADLTDRLAAFADAADERCVKLRLQLDHAEAMAAMLNRLGRRRRRRTKT